MPILPHLLQRKSEQYLDLNLDQTQVKAPSLWGPYMALRAQVLHFAHTKPHLCNRWDIHPVNVKPTQTFGWKPRPDPMTPQCITHTSCVMLTKYLLYTTTLCQFWINSMNTWHWNLPWYETCTFTLDQSYKGPDLTMEWRPGEWAPPNMWTKRWRTVFLT